jgi:serine/threonine protein kinase
MSDCVGCELKPTSKSQILMRRKGKTIDICQELQSQNLLNVADSDNQLRHSSATFDPAFKIEVFTPFDCMFTLASKLGEGSSSSVRLASKVVNAGLLASHSRAYDIRRLNSLNVYKSGNELDFLDTDIVPADQDFQVRCSSGTQLQRVEFSKIPALVAIKTYRNPDEDCVQNIILEEFKLLSRLKHPSIVKVYDVLQYRSNVFLAMEFIDGVSIDRWVKVHKMPFSEEDARAIMSQVFSAVDYIHSKRIAHRDLKPDNIIVSADLKRAVLIDFNVARRVKEGMLSPRGTWA